MSRLAARKGSTDSLSDSQLVDRTRDGDERAYAELWQRHYRAGLTVARAYTSAFDPDDLVSEAFTRMFAVIADGGGPTSGFRPYLFTVIRNTAASWGRRAAREIAIEHAEEIEDLRFSEASRLAELDRSLAARAFRALPPRWQEVLWYTEVEELPPREVAPLLGMSANSVAALAVRAREGLRASWIQAHLATAPEDSECRWAIEHLGVGLRRRLSVSVQRRLDDHLADCADCRLVAAEAADANRHIGFVLLPLAAGVAGAAAYGSGAGNGGSAAASAAEPAAGSLTRGSWTRGSWTWGSTAVVASAVVAAVSLAAVALGVMPRVTVSAPVADGARPSASPAPQTPDAVDAEAGPGLVPAEPPVTDPAPPVSPDDSAGGAPAARPAPDQAPAPTATATPPLATPTPTPSPTPTPAPSAPLPTPAFLGPASTIRSGLATVYGTALPGSIVAVALADASGAVRSQATATTSADGAWSVTLDLSGVPDADYMLTAVASDGARVSASATAPVTLARAADHPGDHRHGQRTHRAGRVTPGGEIAP